MKTNMQKNKAIITPIKKESKLPITDSQFRSLEHAPNAFDDFWEQQSQCASVPQQKDISFSNASDPCKESISKKSIKRDRRVSTKYRFDKYNPVEHSALSHDRFNEEQKISKIEYLSDVIRKLRQKVTRQNGQLARLKTKTYGSEATTSHQNLCHVYDEFVTTLQKQDLSVTRTQNIVYRLMKQITNGRLTTRDLNYNYIVDVTTHLDVKDGRGMRYTKVTSLFWRVCRSMFGPTCMNYLRGYAYEGAQKMHQGSKLTLDIAHYALIVPAESTLTCNNKDKPKIDTMGIYEDMVDTYVTATTTDDVNILKLDSTKITEGFIGGHGDVDFGGHEIEARTKKILIDEQQQRMDVAQKIVNIVRTISKTKEDLPKTDAISKNLSTAETIILQDVELIASKLGPIITDYEQKLKQHKLEEVTGPDVASIRFNTKITNSARTS
jgi:hypothetical protein